MPAEIRNCQNCRQDFSVEEEDFNFYQKIKVPPPTFCPPCRLQRRVAFRNERSLYKRECGLCGQGIVSMYSAEKPFPVYCSQCWWSDRWDPMHFGQEYDFNKSFFEQFRELMHKVPRPNMRLVNSVNSDYCNYVADAKNSYLCFGSIEIEDCLYGNPYESKYCVDTYLARECEYCYECIDCEKLTSSLFAQDCANSMNLLYCFDCKNCQDCIGSVGLRNKKYCIFNEEVGKEEYQKAREEILRRGYPALREVQERFSRLKLQVPRRYATILQSDDVAGDHIVQSKNARKCFDVKRCQDTRHCIRLIDAQDTHDTNYCEYLELCYDYFGFWKVARTKFSNTCGECADITYSDFCSSSNDLFGCIALQKKQYCILNKQYSKEEYSQRMGKIIEHMNTMPYTDQKGRVYKYGEYFPLELSPFAYNESVVQEYFPLTKEQIEARGYAWKEPEEKNYQVTLASEQVPDTLQQAGTDITQQVIGCAHGGKCTHQCTVAFRIIPQELEFYQRMNIPLPRACPNCRHHDRLALRNPFTLWQRKCQCAGVQSENFDYRNTAAHSHGEDHCPNEFETSYSPERPEIIYCEACYQNEVV